MSTYSLAEVDSLEILGIVDNELDPISPSPHPDVKSMGSLRGVHLTDVNDPSECGGAPKMIRMDSICCGAHGLSLMITVTKGDTKHTLLFDTGPEEEVFERNATRLKADLGAIEHIHLSHYHRDHSGGLLKAISMIHSARGSSSAAPVTVDLHPDRPDYRGFNTGQVIISLEADPSFEEVEQAGATLVKDESVRTVLDDMFLVSGSIPRVTSYEQGFMPGVRFDNAVGKWVPDQLIMEERFVAVNLKGKGLVVFTGCSHAGVINATRHAKDLVPDVPMYSVVGGFHLADSDEEKISQTIADFEKIGPKILMPGHCTGWKFKHAWDRARPGQIVPMSVGRNYAL